MAGGDGIRVLVCVKRVPAPGARIALTPDGRDIDTRNLGFTTSPHEECAVEEAIRLVEAHGGTTTVLTVGPPAADEQLRYALSVGAGAAVLVTTDGPDPDAQATARALVRAIGALEVEDGPFDLVLFGNESADAGGFQVGIRVARALGRPVVNGVKGLAVDGDAVLARREATDGLEVYRLSMPAVVGVKEGINLPRYPTMKGRLASRKAVVTSRDAIDEPGGQVLVRLLSPPEAPSHLVVLGEGPGAAAAVVDVLVERGVV